MPTSVQSYPQRFASVTAPLSQAIY